MALAKKHTLVLQKMIHDDMRFEKVVISDGGTSEKIWAGGFVRNDEDLTNLKKIVSESNPPRPVKYHVKVEPLAFE